MYTVRKRVRVLTSLFDIVMTLRGGGQRRSQVSLVGGADRIPGGE